MLWSPPERRPVLMLVSTTAICVGNAVSGDPVYKALLLGALNALEISICWQVLRRMRVQGEPFAGLPNLLKFWFGCLVACIACAPFAAAVESIVFQQSVTRYLLSWCFGDAFSYAVIGTALIELRPFWTDRLWRERPNLYAAAALVAIAAVSTLAFQSGLAEATVVVVLLMVVAGFRFGRLTAAAAILMTVVIADVALNFTGLAKEQQAEAKFAAQFLLLGCALVAFPVATVVASRRQAQTALDQTRRDYQILADHSSDLILRCDTEHRIIFASPSARQFGYAPHRMIGRIGSEFACIDDRPDIQARFRSMMRGDAQVAGKPGEFRFIRADGSTVWVEVKSEITRDDAGRISGLVSVFRDIAGRKALEADLVLKREEAEAASVAKSEFLANMSHELRTPLNNVVAYAGLLEARNDLSSEALAQVSRLASGARSLHHLIDEILDFSRIEAGQVLLRTAPMSPAAVLEEAVALVHESAKSKGLELVLKLDDTLPATVMADEARLRQILLNLLSNAVKFTSSGGVRLDASYDASNEKLRCSVVDTGVGVPAEVQALIFQRFWQADGSSTRRAGGAGLGLAICQGLVSAMGGEIGVSSSPGEGATFWFEAPAPRAVANRAKLETDPDLQAVAAETLHILVVDDVAANREIVSAILTPFAARITQAADGVEALNAASEQRFDLILMDLQMPVMDGLAAARAIRAQSIPNRDTPILAVSANALPVHVTACKEAGMNGHIAKPISPSVLIQEIAAFAA